MNQKELITKAKEAMQKAYAPYSNFKVGAAILLNDNTYILGCNVENASYGLSNCAERTAIFSMIASGYHKEDVQALCIIANDKKPISPCGACRQVLHEHLKSDTPIILTNLNGDLLETTIEDLLPYGFDLDHE